MTSRFLADSLDLSRLPDPTLVAVDYEASLADRMARIKAGFAAAGLDYDVEKLEFDPAKVVEEADAYREMLARQAINDAGRSNMLAHARGAALDQLAANFGVVRLIVGYDAQDVAIMESDDRLRRRAQLAPEAFSTAGAAAAYIFHALSAAPTIADASVQNPSPGRVTVSIMGSGVDPAPSQAELDKVTAHLFRDDVKPLTDVLTVRAATVIVTDLAADLVLYQGPDAATVVADARANLAAFLKANKRLGRDLRLGAWVGRLYRDTVHSVIPRAPLADVIATPGEVVWAKTIEITPAGIDE